MESELEAQLEALMIIDQLHRDRETFLTTRQGNLNAANVSTLRTSFRKNPQVKSDVKKSTAFVKKLKNITAEGIQQCIRDTDLLNLSLYISEIVNAILSISFKATDCSHMVKLCLSLHQKYDEFTEPLVQGLKTALLSASNEDQDVENNKRKRIQIRLLIELFQIGLFHDEELFVALMRQLLGKMKINNAANAKPTADLQGLTVFVKYGSEYLLGYVPKKIQEIANKAEKSMEELPVKLLASSKHAADMRMLLSETYDKLCEHLIKAHKDYRIKEVKYEKDKLIHGQLNDSKQQEYENCKKLYERFLSIVTTLSECTTEKMPELVVEKEEESGSSSGGITVWDGSGIGNAHLVDDGGIFGDAETRAFYEDLPDLLTLVPLSVLGFTPEQAKAMQEEWSNKKAVVDESMKIDNVTVADAAVGVEDAAVDDNDAFVDPDEITNAPTEAVAGEGGGEESKGDKLNVLLTETLFECVNKQKCDDFCVSFCYVNNKLARKKFIYAINRITKQRSELAPMFARIVASLNRIFPDIVPGVLEGQRKEFFSIMKVKKTLHLDIKLRNVRYQGEMIKFQLAPPIVAFRMFKLLLAEFTPHNVEMLAMLLETCGRYLYLLPYTHDSMEEILETMLRLRRARYVDIHLQTILENAYFAVKPPDRSSKTKQKKVLTIAQQYTRYLIMDRLKDTHSSGVEDVIKSIRRLPWNVEEEQILFHVVKASLKLARSKYTAVATLADCLSGLMKYYPNVIIHLVDRIWEEIQRALDSPFKRDIQRILGLTKLFGELYNFTALPSTAVFDLLYYLINLDHQPKVPGSTVDIAAAIVVGKQQHGQYLVHDPRTPSELDNVTDLFRTQLICEIINTTGMYFVRGQSKDRMNRFLLYFQRYLLTKQFVPLHIEFAILDTLDTLEEQAREVTAETMKKQVKGRGGVKEAEVIGVEFPRYDSFEEVQKVIEAMETTERTRWLEKQAANGGVAVESDEEVEDDRDGPADGKDAAVDAEREGGEASDDSEGDDDDSDDSDDSDSDSDSDGSDSDSDSDSDGSDGSDEDDQLNEEDEIAEEIQAARMLEKLRIAEEDDEFEKAFKNVVQESISSVTTKHQDVTRMAIPAVLPKPKNTFNLEDQDEDDGDEKKAKHVMPFKLLSRDNKGRIEARQLMVPETNPMAQKVIKAEEQVRIERQKLKERVLQINSLAGDNDYEAEESAESGKFGHREMYITPAGSATGAGVVIATKPGRGGGGGRGGGPRLVPIRAEDSRKPADTLNLDEFLAEANASEIRRLGKKP